MATGIQTGIRTGASAPLPTGKGPAGGGLGKVMQAWNSLSSKMKALAGGIVVVLVVGTVAWVSIASANKPVSLYQTNLSPGDIQEISAKLNQLGIFYKVESGKIMVAPADQSRIVGLLINYGLPHWSVAAAPEASGMTPKTEFEKRLQQTHELEARLVDDLRQVDFIADARVNIVQTDEDSLTQSPAKATVILKLKPGQTPKGLQIQSIINLVASSVPGLQPEKVSVTDTFMRVYNDGSKIMAQSSTGDSEAFEDEHIAIKKAYERVYADKVKEALNKMMGADKYTVTVDADIDFNQTKIETTQVGDPSGNGTVVSVVKKDEETYNNSPGGKDAKKSGASSQVGIGPTGGDPSANTKYEKIRYEQKLETSKVQKTAIIAPNVVKRLTATVAVDGKYDTEAKSKLASICAGAMGIDTSRGDKVDVVDWAFERTNTLTAEVPLAPEPAGVGQRDGGPSKTMFLMAMLVPTTILLGVLTVFLLKQRRVQADRQGLVMTMGPGATTSDISDLLSDKIGRSTAATQTTRVNNTEQLEKLAKEKPTKVAELLKSTWLSDRER